MSPGLTAWQRKLTDVVDKCGRTKGSYHDKASAAGVTLAFAKHVCGSIDALLAQLEAMGVHDINVHLRRFRWPDDGENDKTALCARLVAAAIMDAVDRS